MGQSSTFTVVQGRFYLVLIGNGRTTGKM